MHTATKQLTQLADIQMTMYSTPTAHLEMIHTNLIFAKLKTSLYRPTRESGSKQFFQRNIIGTWHHIRDKILNLIRIQNITSDDKTMSRTRQTIGTLFTIKFRPLNFPDYRAFFAIFNMKLSPLLFLKCTRIYKKIRNFACRQCLCRKTRKYAFSPSYMPFLRCWRKQNSRLFNPAGKVGWYFGNIVLPKCTKAIKKRTVSAVEFIKCPGEDTDTIVQRMSNLSKCDVSFLAIFNIFRNTRKFTTPGIIRPLSGIYRSLSRMHWKSPTV